MGNRITDIAPPQGFGAETSSAAVILSSAAVGFPLSTTHVVAGGVVGSGLGRFKSLWSVNWGVFGTMVIAWLLTLPGAALIAGIAGLATGALGGTGGVIIVLVVAMAGGIGIWLAAQRDPITPDNVNDVTAEEAALAGAGSI
jgi:PiT family inorganic phosphate transporter